MLQGLLRNVVVVKVRIPMPRGFESLGGCAVMDVPHFGTTAIAALDPAMGLRMAGRAQALLDALFAAGALEDVRTGGPQFPAQAASREFSAMVSQAFLNSASPTKRLCLTAFPTPHDRLLRDGYGLRRPSRPRSLVQRPPGRFTAFADDSTDGRDALPSASGRRSRATLRRTARPSSFWGA